MGDQNPEIWKAAAMADHFEKIQKLPEKIDGVPNFRRVPGYKVYCCGQPTIAGFENAINKACGDIYPKDGPIIWVNMRQEPIVYINGNPICARPPNKIGEYAELGNVTRESVKKDEEEFVHVIEGRMKGNDGKLKYLDVQKAEHEVEVKELLSLHDVIEKLKEKFPKLTHNRIPVCNSAAPLEEDFDTLSSALQGTPINAPVIVNCQAGLSRSTTGCVAACMFREFQLAGSYEGLVETVPGVDQTLLRMDRYKMDMSKEPLFRGDFEVIKELLAALPDGEASKREADKVIDKNGPAKGGGSGIKHLRENIAESKLSYEIMDDAAQAFLKSKIMDNIHKYFYLIVFAAYTREAAVLVLDSATEEDKKAFSLTGGKLATPADKLKLPKTFVQYMEEHANLRTIVDEGKGKLQWERDIPAEALANLENLASTDFQANLGKIIHDIYQTAHGLFRDLPQGDHKKRAKYRFASKTLMRVLPTNLKAEVEGLIEKQAMTLDLYEILGQCTWGQAKLAA
jgi:protein-tyrosine phosphatase